MSETMTGGGDYDRHSDYQVRGATSHTDLIVEAAQQMETAGCDAVVIADYGSAQARTSNAVLTSTIETIRATDTQIPICVYHNDLLANDWTGLFDRLRGEDSYLSIEGGPITPLVSATSFYNPATPPGVVDLAMSFAAIQWLAEPGPAGTGSALYFDQLEGDAATAMAEQARTDLELFLERRATELAPGGRAVFDMMGRRENGAAAGHEAWAIVRSIAEELVAEGRLDGGKLDGYVIPIYERTLGEIEQAFSGPVGERLRLEHLAIADVVNPASERYRADGDAVAFAAAFVGFFRAFSEPSLRAALDPEGEAIDDLYRRLQARLTDRAETFDFTVHPATLVLSAT